MEGRGGVEALNLNLGHTAKQSSWTLSLALKEINIWEEGFMWLEQHICPAF